MGKAMALTTVILGAIMISYGAWLLLPAAGFIVGGFACLAVQNWAFSDPERRDM